MSDLLFESESGFGIVLPVPIGGRLLGLELVEKDGRGVVVVGGLVGVMTTEVSASGSSGQPVKNGDKLLISTYLITY